MLRLATVHSTIVPDVRANGRTVRDCIRAAAEAGARLVHFPEGALSGSIGSEVKDWSEANWGALRAELRGIMALARRLDLWVVLGANHRLRSPRWPQNSLYVISDTGELAGRYSKRFCSNTEVTSWYTPGTDPLVFDVDGIRFGCAICIEVVLPHLFAEYERLGVTCMLLSACSNDPAQGLMAKAHAATSCLWVGLSTPASCPALPSSLIGPDGNSEGLCRGGTPGMVLRTIDPEDERYRVPLHPARPWRGPGALGRGPARSIPDARTPADHGSREQAGHAGAAGG